jgi:cell division transport system permease protein
MIGRSNATMPARLPSLGSEMLLLPWTVALAVFMTGVAALGLLIIARSEAAWQRLSVATMTLEVAADTSSARLETVLAVLRQTGGIAAVRLLTPAEEAQLLSPWLGADAQLDGLPLPRLIELTIAADGVVDIADLREKLSSVAPGAKLYDHARWFDAARQTARRAYVALTAAVAAGLLIIARAAVLAARSAVAADLGLIELAHLLGAGDRDIVRMLTLRPLRLALVGGGIAGLAALLALAAFNNTATLAGPGWLVGVGPADWRAWGILALTVMAAGFIVAAVVRAYVERRLADLP